jgi:hypothetical protein
MAKTTPLTNTEVKQAKPKEYKLADGNGLQLRIRPSGCRSWLFDYVNHISRFHWGQCNQVSSS